MIEVTAENYYSKEVNKQYMSFHTWLSLHGCDGIIPCEEKAIKILNEEYKEDPSDALLLGGYIDAHFEGTVDKYAEELDVQYVVVHPEFFPVISLVIPYNYTIFQ